MVYNIEYINSHERLKRLLHTRLLEPAANPIAVLIKPSMPLAPRFPVTWTNWHDKPALCIREALWVLGTQLLAYMSESRTGMLFPKNTADPQRMASESLRAT